MVFALEMKYRMRYLLQSIRDPQGEYAKCASCLVGDSYDTSCCVDEALGHCVFCLSQSITVEQGQIQMRCRCRYSGSTARRVWFEDEGGRIL
jgi:hypothetical protein